MSKLKLGYLLFDLPSDHEIEGTLSTECQAIEAIVHNQGMPARVKRICVASTERFMNHPTYKYGVQFVHLACHGGKRGIGMLGGNVAWSDVAKQVTRHLHPLATNEQRIICFSCCHSMAGFNKISFCRIFHRRIFVCESESSLCSDYGHLDNVLSQKTVDKPT
jgi:hypothetical protein